MASYAFGTKELMSWLDRNPLVEFLGIDAVFNPLNIGRNPKVVTIISARKVDLTGRIVVHAGMGSVVATPGDELDFINGAELSPGGLTVFALPSRNRKGEANIRLTVEEFPNILNVRESVDMVVTDYGVANLQGRTVRERAQSLIDIAHPDDRARLVEEAKAKNIIYQDQIFLSESAHLYPGEYCTDDMSSKEDWKSILGPSNLPTKRKCAASSIASRTRRCTTATSHPSRSCRMPECNPMSMSTRTRVMSVVGLTGPHGEEHIIAEARFVRDQQRPYGDMAFIVDEKYQGLGSGLEALSDSHYPRQRTRSAGFHR